MKVLWLLLLNLFLSPAFAGEQTCNQILADRLENSLNDLARLRVELDLNRASGLSLSVGSALEKAYQTKETELTELYSKQGVSSGQFKKKLTTEIQKLQSDSPVSPQVALPQPVKVAPQPRTISGSVEPLVSLPEVRNSQSQITLKNKEVLVIGGMASSSSVGSKVFVLDPIKNTVRTLTQIAATKLDPALMLLEQDQVLVVGGGEDNALVIDPIGDQVQKKYFLKKKWTHPELYSIDADHVMIFGGEDSGVTDAIETLDLSSGSSTLITFSEPEPRRVGRPTTAINATTLVRTGGYEQNQSSRKIEILHIEENEVRIEIWGDIIEARASHAQMLLSNGKLLLVGGVNSKGRSSDSIELIDLDTGAIEIIGHLEFGRSYTQLTELENGLVVVVGGLAPAQGAAAVEVIDVENKTVTTIGHLSHPRWKHSQSLMGDEMIVVGGHNEDQPSRTVDKIKIEVQIP